MILNGEDPVFWLHPTTCSAEDSEGQENDPRLTLVTRPSRQVFIPVPNSNEAAAAAATVAPPTRDLSSLGHSTCDPTSNNNIRRTPSSSDSNISGFTRSGQFGSMAEATSSSEQVENDDPFPTLVLAPSQYQQRGSGGGCLGNGRRVSSDPEVCELFRESSDVRVTTTTMRCGGGERGSKAAGFQRWKKVEGQRSLVHGGPPSLVASSKTFGGGDLVVPGRYRGQLRDLNVIQRPSLDFDKMQRYCLTRVHPTRGISKPRIVKVKCLPGSTSSFSSLGRVIRSELLDPSIFSFRSISQNPGITSSSSSSRRSSATTPSLSDEN